MRVRPRLTTASTICFAAAGIAFLLFLVRALAYLEQRHPHEDAYILFRYARHLAEGHGIVFNRGGPPTEGATDFLWMVLLAGHVRVGIDVAVAAAWLDALGCGLMAYLLGRVWLEAARPGWPAHVVPLVLAVCLPWAPSALAAYDGFSVQLYVALVVLLFYLWTVASPTAMVVLPYAVLAVALFRPDGALVGAGFFVLALLEALRRRERLRPLVVHGAVALLVGGLYFVWRAWYFGELLPLPLYVKSRGAGGLVGLATDKAWATGATGPLALLLVAFLFAVPLALRRRWRELRGTLALLPAGLLFLALAYARQTQNVDWRFQAPIYAIVLVIVVQLGAGFRHWVEEGLPWRAQSQDAPGMEPRPSRLLGVAGPLVVLVTILVALRPALARGKELFPRDYMDTFAVDAGPTLDGRVVVLTEAGRLPFWTTATVYDMVGLNLAATARKPPTLAYIAGLDPDVVMFHAAGTIDLHRVLVEGVPRRAVTDEDPQARRVVRIDPRSLPEALQGAFRGMRGHLPTAYARGVDTQVKTSSVILGAYLAEHANDFEVYAVPYGSVHNHIVALRTDRPSLGAFRELLVSSVDRPYASYADARHWPHRRACALATAIDGLWGRRHARCGW